MDSPRWRGAPVAALALLAGSVLWLHLGLFGPVPTRVFGALAGAGVALGAAVLCFRHAPAGHSRRSRLAWRAHGLACVVWSVAPLGWGLIGQPTHHALSRPTVSAARWGFLCCSAVALWCTSRAADRRTRVRMLLDGALVSAALFVIAWAVALDRIWHTPGIPQVSVLAALGLPLGDLVLVTFYGLVIVYEFPPGRRHIPSLVMSALCAMAVGDGLAAYLGAIHNRPPDAIARDAWLLAFTLVGWGGARYSGTTPQRRTQSNSRISVYAPYLVLAPAALVVAVQVLETRRIPAAELGAGLVIVVIVLVRQFVMLAENRHLVSSLAARERELRYRALHDPLTGLPNRALLISRLEEALGAGHRCDRLALLFLDLDDFKVVNDSLGHAAGDSLLVMASERLRSAVRPADTVARLGGDEFAVLVTDARDPVPLARRVLDVLTEPFTVAGTRVALSASIGLVEVRHGAAVPGDAIEAGAGVADLLRYADTAMYAAKQAGKNAVTVFTPDLHRAVSRELEMRAALLVALDEDRLDVAYQPITRATDGRIVAFEALARWTDPRYGPVPPDQFVPIADRAHITHRITAAVLERACRDLRRWLDLGTGEPARVGVNIAAVELADPDLPTRLHSALRRHGLSGERLVIEVTETALMTDVDAAVEAIGRLRELGIALAIDDFGTGYSSLARLRLFRVESLKVDKLFVNEVTDERGRQMVVALVALARSCGTRTVAEGVEREDQAEALRDIGCELLQGYLYGRPVPAAEVTRLLIERAGQALPPPPSGRVPALPQPDGEPAVPRPDGEPAAPRSGVAPASPT